MTENKQEDKKKIESIYPQTNLGLRINIKYDKAKEFKNTNKTSKEKFSTFSICGLVEGEDKYVNLTEAQHNILKKHEPLGGKTLILMKYEEGRNKKFRIDIPKNEDAKKGEDLTDDEVKENIEAVSVCKDAIIDSAVADYKKVAEKVGYDLKDITRPQAAVIATIFIQVSKEFFYQRTGAVSYE